MKTSRTVSNIMRVVCLLVLLSCPAGWGRTIYVDDGAPALGDGSSWDAAYTHLQDALAAAETAENPVEIWVARGLYRPDRSEANSEGTGDRAATFQMLSGLILRGGFAGLAGVDPNERDVQVYETILSGDLAGDDRDVDDPCDLVGEPTRIENSFHVVTGSGVEQATVEGVTICAGNAYDWPNPGHGREPYWSEYDNGGGIYNVGGHLTLRQCTLTLNSANAKGGAIFSSQSGEVVLDNCSVSNNSSILEGGGINSISGALSLSKCRLEKNRAPDRNGGAIYSHRSITSVKDCKFRENSAGLGSGLQAYGDQTTVQDCLFEGNRGTSLVTAGDAVILRCTFTGNSGNEGALNMGGATAVVKNCIFSENQATSSGGAVSSTGDAVLENCTFYGNHATRNGGAIYCRYGGTLAIRNCILWGNGAPDGSQMLLEKGLGPFRGLTVVVSHSLIARGKDGVQVDDGCKLVWGIGNMDADPLFVNPAAGDYHLKSQAGRWDTASQSWLTDDVTSPCIDAGDPDSPVGLEPFPNGGRINMGAYGGTAEASKSYFGGPVCETIISGDINGDGTVDWNDLNILASHWLEDGRKPVAQEDGSSGTSYPAIRR